MRSTRAPRPGYFARVGEGTPPRATVAKECCAVQRAASNAASGSRCGGASPERVREGQWQALVERSRDEAEVVTRGVATHARCRGAQRRPHRRAEVGGERQPRLEL